jgi:rubrerythrin
MNEKQLKELLLQSLEQEVGGVQVYETALRCVINDDLREEWEKYLEQTRRHEQILRKLCAQLGIDAEEDSPGRIILRAMGQSLVEAMEQAGEDAEEEAAELVACECVVLAETKDHADWELISKCAEESEGDVAKALKAAAKQVEDEEDEHLYHTKGWARELWLQALGIKPVLPPPEETKDVKTAIEAARAELSRH